MTRNLNENSLTEQPVTEWLKEMGYDYEFWVKIGKELHASNILIHSPMRRRKL